jgi:hypothetical protein
MIAHIFGMNEGSAPLLIFSRPIRLNEANGPDIGAGAGMMFHGFFLQFLLFGKRGSKRIPPVPTSLVDHM